MEKIKNNLLIIEVDNNNIKKIFKRMKKIISTCDKNNLKVKFNILNLDGEYLRDIKDLESAINIKDKKKRYNYIYDTICKYLDERINTNYCQFKNDICIKYRKKGSNHKNGCCECKGRGKCEYLIDGKCTMKSCMACKLFVCPTLRRMGIKQNINDFVLAKYFFDKKEKNILEFSYWTPKEEVMRRLLERDYKPLSSFK